MLKRKKELTAFGFAITEKGNKNYMIYAPKYEFDPTSRVILLKNDQETVIKTIDLTKKGLIKVDIYDKTNPANNYVQTILSGINS